MAGNGSLFAIAVMMDLFQHDAPTHYRFRLAGDLKDAWVVELEHAWQTATSALKERALIVDVTRLTGMDEAGTRLLDRMRQAGAQIVSAGRPWPR